MDKFTKFYKRLGFLRFCLVILGFVFATYGILFLFTQIIGPYVIGLWLIFG